ncbi:MAG TPA: sensor domain-containing protein, partial [Candidatus Acidoferrales bacterium]|nr:sensor domain-containing protein [Candidatus Acidoferrales bacterium]
MTGVAILVTGLLLVLAGLAAARIPGGATFARPGIARAPGTDAAGSASNPIRAFLLSPIHPATWYANGAVLLGFVTSIFAFAIVAALGSAGLSVLIAGVGLIPIAFGIEASRLFARTERWRAFVGEPARPAAHPYKPFRGSAADLLRAEFLDESRWRDVLYVAVNFPLAVLEFVVVVAFWGSALYLLAKPLGPETLFGIALLPVAASISQLVMALHRAVARGLLCTSEARELRRQVETLRESRSAVMDVEASELHRIERDLHDGAQQRLVALTIDLGLASEKVADDPAAAKALIAAGQEQAREALAEIRSLVRGIAPSILLDRGLVAALESIAGHGPVPVSIVSGLAPGERLPLAVERTAYFVATEALTNVAKHSGATRCEVRCRRDGDRLVVEIWDDGAGGASVQPGGGLAGLASRIAGVDGTFSVSSPAGGPTVVRAEIPIGGASPAPEEPRSY